MNQAIGFLFALVACVSSVQAHAMGLELSELTEELASPDAWLQIVSEQNTQCRSKTMGRLSGPRNCVKSSRDLLEAAGLGNAEQRVFLPGGWARIIGEYVRDNPSKLPAGWKTRHVTRSQPVDPRLGGLIFYSCRVGRRTLGHVAVLAGGMVYDNYTRGSASKRCPGTKRGGKPYIPGTESCAKDAFIQLYNEAWVTPFAKAGLAGIVQE